jgi:hypothetical protein
MIPWDTQLQDVFAYLDGQKALAGIKWELRASFGSAVFRRQEEEGGGSALKTLEELKISANTLFIVQEV